MPRINFFGRPLELPNRMYYRPEGGDHDVSLTYHQADASEARPDEGPITYLVGECFVTANGLEDALSMARDAVEGPSEKRGDTLRNVSQALSDHGQFGDSYLWGYFWATVAARVDDEDHVETLAGVAANMTNRAAKGKKEKAEKSEKRKGQGGASTSAAAAVPSGSKGKQEAEDDEPEAEEELPELPLMYEIHDRRAPKAKGQVHFEAVATAQIGTFLQAVADRIGLAPKQIRVKIVYEWDSADGGAKNACDACQNVARRFFETFGGECNIVVTEQSKPKHSQWRCPQCLKVYPKKTNSGLCTDQKHKGKKPVLEEI